MDQPILKHLNALNLIPEVGQLALAKLLKYFKKDIALVWKSSFSELKQTEIQDFQIKAILDSQNKIQPDKEWEKLIKEKVQIITIEDDDFPKDLRHIYYPPTILYFKGSLSPKKNCFAIVGTRLPSDYGKSITPVLTKDICSAGFTIVSGLAIGIDAIAHESTIENKQRTIGIIACGLDRESFYPKDNLKLFDRMIENGAVISEFPIGTKVSKEKFPMRNRLISGMSKGILIIEADIKSGAMITARLGLEQNKDIFAVPGNILSKNSRGTNLLIKQGAKLVSSAQDILEDYELSVFDRLQIQRQDNKYNQ